MTWPEAPPTCPTHGPKGFGENCPDCFKEAVNGAFAWMAGVEMYGSEIVVTEELANRVRASVRVDGQELFTVTYQVGGLVFTEDAEDALEALKARLRAAVERAHDRVEEAQEAEDGVGEHHALQELSAAAVALDRVEGWQIPTSLPYG